MVVYKDLPEEKRQGEIEHPSQAAQVGSVTFQILVNVKYIEWPARGTTPLAGLRQAKHACFYKPAQNHLAYTEACHSIVLVVFIATPPRPGHLLMLQFEVHTII